MDRGCEDAGTQEIVDDLMNESLCRKLRKTIYAEDVQLVRRNAKFTWNFGRFL